MRKGERLSGKPVRWLGDGTVPHIRQQHDLDITYRIDHRDGPSPAGVSEGSLARPAVEVVVPVRSLAQSIGRVTTIRGKKSTLHIGREVFLTLVNALVRH